MLALIPVIVAEFLTCCNIAYGHNPQGGMRFFYGTVRITGMVDIAGSIGECLAVDSIAIILMKDVGIAFCAAASALLVGNLFTNVGNNPGPLWDILRRKESLSSNARWADTYLNLHRLPYVLKGHVPRLYSFLIHNIRHYDHMKGANHAGKGLVFVTGDRLGDQLTALLEEAGCQVVRGPQPQPSALTVFPREEWPRWFGETDVLVVSPLDVCTREVMAAAPRLRAVVSS